ncbi:hypothetical protein SDC9_06008 [bioreactor metagenome]|uniref:HD-GYP domain-containing protein n=1 Tax=bioreactor metagenome TaxID=1076179 RepID=A0A644T1U4_9ZZZZ|nr:HD-GYP domain-containing protein [Negativicutes bacterium]
MGKINCRKCHIDAIIPGMKLGKTILTEEGKVALAEGIVLTSRILDRLRTWNLTYLDIYDASVELENQHPVTYSQQNFFDKYSGTVDFIKYTFDTIRLLKTVPIDDIRHLVGKAIDPLIHSVGVINHLHMVQRQDDYTYHHSVNVAVIAGVLGKWLGLKENELLNICLTGLLHDVGKTQIPLSILNNPNRLTAAEMDVMRKHTTLGYRLIQNIPELPLSVKYGVLQHHERNNGTGYPLMLNGDQIHLFAKIVSIADIYDAMTSDRIYHQKSPPFEVVELMVKEMFGSLDPLICSVFLNNVRDYFLGNTVALDDGREAEVVYLGHFISCRPVVRTVDGDFIDLEKNKTLSIAKLVKA